MIWGICGSAEGGDRDNGPKIGRIANQAWEELQLTV